MIPPTSSPEAGEGVKATSTGRAGSVAMVTSNIDVVTGSRAWYCLQTVKLFSKGTSVCIYMHICMYFLQPEDSPLKQK